MNVTLAYYLHNTPDLEYNHREGLHVYNVFAHGGCLAYNKLRGTISFSFIFCRREGKALWSKQLWLLVILSFFPNHSEKAQQNSFGDLAVSDHVITV